MKKRPTKAVKEATKGKTAPAKVRRLGEPTVAKARASSPKKETGKRLVEKKIGSTLADIETMVQRMRSIRAEAKHRSRKPAGKKDSEAAQAKSGKGSKKASQTTLPAGLPILDFEIHDSGNQAFEAWQTLMAGTRAEELEVEDAMAQAGDLFWKILDSIFASAHDEPKTARGKWAGGLLAEVLVALSKREDALDSNTGFRSRWRVLKSLRIPTTPLWGWIELAYLRMNFLLEWDEGLHPTAALSSFEKSVPSILDRIKCMEEDKLRKAMFEEILWPWMKDQAVEIQSQPWFEPLAKSRHGEVKTLTLALLKKDFREAWKVFINRPEGKLTGIERPR